MVNADPVFATRVGLTLVCDDAWLRGDRLKLMLALRNLLENAVKYSPPDTDIQLAAHHSGNGRRVSIKVRDQGIGMNEQERAQAFEKFYRADKSGTIPGTGLGLATVLGIAENHGGFVHLETQVGEGTKFLVHIPAAPGESEAHGSGAGEAETQRGAGELILVVDDEPAVRRLASAILVRQGYRTLTAAEGREGLAMFQQHHADIRLVISDVMMPQMDGPGMLRSLLQMEPNLKSIVITGLGEEHRVAEAKAAGANAVLHKPFTADQLLTQVRQLLAELK